MLYQYWWIKDEYISQRHCQRTTEQWRYRQHARKIRWSSAVWFLRYASGQTDRQTHRRTCRQLTDIVITIPRTSLGEVVINPQPIHWQTSCTVAKITARCADKSKQTASANSHTSTYNHVTLGWLNSTGRYGHRCYGRRCWTNIFSPKFLHVPLGVGEWPLGYEERRRWANCSRN